MMMINVKFVVEPLPWFNLYVLGYKTAMNRLVSRTTQTLHHTKPATSPVVHLRSIANMSGSLPSTMQAIKIHDNKAKVVSGVPLPKLRPTYVLTKVDSIALNPTDWKHIAGKRAAPNGTAGCDFAGTVVEVGPEVTKSLKPGDRVAGTTHGANYSEIEDGCFADYAMAKGDLLVKLPESLSFEEAATFPLGVSTVGQGLFQKALKLNLPTNPITTKESVLIYVCPTSMHLRMKLTSLGRFYRNWCTCDSVCKTGWLQSSYHLSEPQFRYSQISGSRWSIRLYWSRMWC